MAAKFNTVVVLLALCAGRAFLGIVSGERTYLVLPERVSNRKCLKSAQNILPWNKSGFDVISDTSQESSLGNGVMETRPKESEPPVTIEVEHGETAENPGNDRVLVHQQRYQLVLAGTCKPVHTSTHQCTPVHTNTYPCTPAMSVSSSASRACSCGNLHTSTHQCTPVHANTHRCTSVPINTHPCTPVHTSNECVFVGKQSLFLREPTYQHTPMHTSTRQHTPMHISAHQYTPVHTSNKCVFVGTQRYALVRAGTCTLVHTSAHQ